MSDDYSDPFRDEYVPWEDGIEAPNRECEYRSLAEFGHPNYAVSNQGDVYNLRFGRPVKPNTIWSGYNNVRIDGRNIGVHRLVAKAFVPNPDPTRFNIVDHIDCDNQNNCADNLRWTDLRGNLDHQVQVGSLPPRIPDEVVHQICRDLSNGVGCTEIARKYGVSHDAVFQIKRGENWRHISQQYNVVPPKKYHTRLTEAQVIEICQLLNTTCFTYEKIAEIYNTSVHAIKAIASGQNWSQITSQYLSRGRH